MRIQYICDHCGAIIAVLDMAEIDEAKLGFNCLTADERAAIIEVDEIADEMRVKSLCDVCIMRLKMQPSSEPPLTGALLLH